MACPRVATRSSGDETGAHQPESEHHRATPAEAHADHAGGQRADHAADRPRDEANRDVLGPHAEALGAVEGEPRREGLEDHLQHERGEEHGAQPGNGTAHRGPDRAPPAIGTSPRPRSPPTPAAREARPRTRGRSPTTVPAATRKAGRMPSIRPSIRNTIAPTHSETSRSRSRASDGATARGRP